MTSADLLPAAVLKRKAVVSFANRPRPRSRPISRANAGSMTWSRWGRDTGAFGSEGFKGPPWVRRGNRAGLDQGGGEKNRGDTAACEHAAEATARTRAGARAARVPSRAAACLPQ